MTIPHKLTQTIIEFTGTSNHGWGLQCIWEKF